MLHMPRNGGDRVCVWLPYRLRNYTSSQPEACSSGSNMHTRCQGQQTAAGHCYSNKNTPPAGVHHSGQRGSAPRQLKGAHVQAKPSATGSAHLRSTHTPTHTLHTPSDRSAAPPRTKCNQPRANSPPAQNQQPEGAAKRRTPQKTTCSFLLRLWSLCWLLRGALFGA